MEAKWFKSILINQVILLWTTLCRQVPHKANDAIYPNKNLILHTLLHLCLWFEVYSSVPAGSKSRPFNKNYFSIPEETTHLNLSSGSKAEFDQE